MQRPSRGALLPTRQARTPSTAVLVTLLLLGASCTRREPPTWDAGAEEPVAWPAGTGAPAAHPIASALATATAAAVSSAATTAGLAAATSVADGDAPPPVGASAPELPAGEGEQTKDRPDSRSPSFEARARALFEAIVSDDPEKARAAFFPLAAYERVKDVAKPASDYRVRLFAAFKRDIHDYHVALKHPDQTTFIEMRVPDDRARWVEPGEEYNKLGYYRVFGSKLVVRDGTRVRELRVKSLISWRGEWYVVHLASIE